MTTARGFLTMSLSMAAILVFEVLAWVGGRLA